MLIKRSYYFRPERTFVRFRIRWDKNELVLFISAHIDETKWSRETQRCKNNTTHFKRSASEINRELSRYESSADSVFLKFEAQDHTPTKDELRNELYTILNIKDKNKQQTQEFYTLFDKWVSEESVLKEWTNTTINTLSVYKHRLQKWNANLTIDEINDDTLTSLMLHLINEGYRNSTTAKTIEIVKWYLRWLKKRGYYHNNAHETFQPKIKGREKREAEIFLTWDELQQLYNAELPSEPLRQVRDVFCFCCFTSLRYSDVAKLQRSDVFQDHIQTVTKKTNEPLTIQLNKYSAAILDRYKDKRFRRNTALPVISNQKYNEQIKVVAKLVGINSPVRLVYFVGNTRHEEVKEKWKLLTTHAARRTFIVNALTLGIPSEVVMKWSGHTHHESMLPYIAIVEKLKQEQMERFNK